MDEKKEKCSFAKSNTGGAADCYRSSIAIFLLNIYLDNDAAKPDTGSGFFGAFVIANKKQQLENMDAQFNHSGRFILFCS